MTKIQTTHICKMLAEALRLAETLNGMDDDDLTKRVSVNALERSVNLCRHAAEELEDERLRFSQGWPII